MDQAIISFLSQFVVKFPWLAGVVGVVGVLRLVCKPLFSFLHSVAAATPSPSDDLLLDKVEKSAFMKGVLWVLDWLGSIKLEKPPQA